MSLFGDDDDAASGPKPAASLFDDEIKPTGGHRATNSNSLFADESAFGGDGEDSPWSFAAPKKAKRERGALVRSLLPVDEVPESYVDAYDALLEAGERAENNAGHVSLAAARRLVEGAGLPQETQARILDVVALAGQEEAGLGRSEFHVLFALVGLAQEGEDVTLDSVDERKRNLPVPDVSLPARPAQQQHQHNDTRRAPPAMAPSSSPPQPPPSPPRPHRQPPQPTTPSRPRGGAMRKQSFGDPEADPWASPDLHKGHGHSSYTAIPTQGNANGNGNGNGNGGGSASRRTTSQFTTTSASTTTLHNAAAPQPPNTLGSEGGWGGFNGGAGDAFAGAGGLGSAGFGSSPGGLETGGVAIPSRSIGAPRPVPRGVEESVTISTLAEKEGMFLFQHRNYEVASARRNSKVVRRYSDFVWLLDCLHKRYAFRQLPLLPPKRVAINGNYLAADASFVEKRRKGLARFANALVRHPVLSQEQLVVMFLTVPTELAVWRKQATISVQEEFASKPLPPDLEDSLPKTLPELFDTVRSGVRRSAEIYINLCTMTERLTKRNEGIAAESLRFATALHTLTQASADTYACDTADVPLLNDGLVSTARHLEQSKMLLEDEARGWEEGVLEDLKRQRDALVSVRDMFDRRDKFAKDNIPYLEKRIAGNEVKLQGIRAKPEGVVKVGEAEKVEEAIVRDKESIVAQHARGVFITQCVRDELLYFQNTQYAVGRLHQEWAQERVKYGELMADNWRGLSEEVEGMPTGE